MSGVPGLRADVPRLHHFTYDSPDNPWCGGGGAVRDFEILARIAPRWDATAVCGRHPAGTAMPAGCTRQDRGTSLAGELVSRWTFALSASRFARTLLDGGDGLLSQSASAFAPVFALGAPSERVLHVVHHVAGREVVRRLGPLGLLGLRYERRVLRNGTWYATPNRATARRIAEANPDARIWVVPNGIVPPPAPPVPFRLPDGSPYILFFGRIDHAMKGLDRLLAAFALVGRQHPGLSLVFGGRADATSRRWLGDEFARHPFRDRLHLVANPDDATKYALMAGARLFASPSRFEGWCIAAIEAASQGLPAVATRVDGFLDSVVDGRTGLLVSNDDKKCIDELAAALARLLSDEETRREMGEAARRRAARFTWDAMAALQEEILVLARRRLSQGGPLPEPGIRAPFAEA